MQKIKIGDVCDVLNGFAFKSENYVGSGIRVIRIANVQKGYIEDTTPAFYPLDSGGLDKYMLENGDLLMSLTGNVGRVAMLEADMLPAALNQRVACLRLKSSKISKKYLFHILNSDYFEQQCIQSSKGVAQKNMSTEWLKDYEIPLYSPEHQNKIVSVLDRVHLIINTQKKQLQKLDELVKARFVELFGDPILNQKQFPVYRMDEVVEFQGGSQPDKKFFEYEPTDDNIRLIQIRDYKTDKFITYIPRAMAKRFCTADDIMIGRYGPPIFQILQGIEGSFNVALMKATPKKGNKEFVRQFLKQECLLDYLEGMSKRTAGQDGIQMDKLKAYPFPLPPVELQNQFEKFANQVDKSKVAVQKSLDEAQLLFDSLMQQYFG
ncbi:restriction endonuclease subunit S [Gemmiger sp.]|uniref:restriction endonuclease subunit S n=1 Tax=Gemmiger sp. TaxID=2049027 RepID=UPI002A82EF73|nr:restriction endonuclease subunit S [Gemmiger sp.]MDY4447608.1 restriction endonuclease subunit S [Gemmiger sp.]